MTLPSPAASTAFAAVVVAAGSGLRAGGALPKQFAQWRGKPLLRHSLEALVQAGAAPVVVVIPAGFEAEAAAAIGDIPAVLTVRGAATRQGSVRAGLVALAATAPELVLIHDAARPDIPAAVIAALVEALAQQPGAIPVLPVVDSVVRGSGGLREEPVERDGLYRVQTPQAFRFAAIVDAHRRWTGNPDAGDDAAVAQAAGLAVALVQGDERLRKVTFAADFEDDGLNIALPRTGFGFDVHRLTAGEELWLCGVRIAHDKGLAGHSDADVAVHALVDALLGAIAAGDIGDHFPPSDPQWRGAASHVFLSHAAALVRDSGHAIANVDVTIVCEAPRIGPHKQTMRTRLADILGIDIGRVSVKATTTERLGSMGRGEGIAAQAVATVVPA